MAQNTLRKNISSPVVIKDTLPDTWGPWFGAYFVVESPVEYGRMPPNDKRAGEVIIAGLDLRVREYSEFTLVEPN